MDEGVGPKTRLCRLDNRIRLFEEDVIDRCAAVTGIIVQLVEVESDQRSDEVACLREAFGIIDSGAARTTNPANPISEVAFDQRLQFGIFGAIAAKAHRLGRSIIFFFCHSLPSLFWHEPFDFLSILALEEETVTPIGRILKQ